jgi:hyperosmotically inducible periplasmic protein
MNSGSLAQHRGSRQLVLALWLGLAACGEKPPAAGHDPGRAAVAPAPAAPEASAAIQPKPAPAQTAGGASIEDAALAAKIKSALVADREVNALEIDVAVARGVVTLYGTAATGASRDRATRVASGIEGVKSVTNKLAVVAGS